MWRRFYFVAFRSHYPLAGCSPAEPASVWLDGKNLTASWAGSIVGAFNLLRRSIGQRTVQPLAIVEDFAVIEGCSRELVGSLKLAADHFAGWFTAACAPFWKAIEAI